MKEERIAKLERIIRAIDEILASTPWKVLKMELLDTLHESLERQLSSEAKSPVVKLEKLYRLQGQLLWARRYSHLEELQKEY